MLAGYIGRWMCVAFMYLKAYDGMPYSSRVPPVLKTTCL